jgi:hypothetical protein
VINGNGIINGWGVIQAQTLTNSGIINANVAPHDILIDSVPSVTNTGTFEATNHAKLALSGLAIDNASGTITTATNGLVDIDSTTISGGTINNANSITQLTIIQLTDVSGSSPELDGSSQGVLTVGGTLDLNTTSHPVLVTGTIQNNGLITDVDSNNPGLPAMNLQVVGAATFLGGTGGVLNMGQAGSAFYANNGTLTNGSGHTIQGQGSIQDPAALVNSGTIDANIANGTLNVEFLYDHPSIPTLTNTGTLESTASSSTLQLTAIAVNNSGGTITASGGGEVLLSNVPSLSGGTIDNAGGIIEIDNFADHQTDMSGTINVFGTLDLNCSTASAMQISGTIVNNGTITDTDPSNPNMEKLFVELGGPTTFASNTGGILNMGQPGASIYGHNNTFTNGTGHTTQGQGSIYGMSTLTNNGTVSANLPGATLTVGTLSNALQNAGTLEATASASKLELSGIAIYNTGGTLTASTGGRVDIDGSSVYGGTLSNAGGIVEITDTAGPSALTGDISSVGSITVLGTVDVNVKTSAVVVDGIINNNGTITDTDPNNPNLSSMNLSVAGAATFESSNGNGCDFYNGAGHTIQGQGSIHGISQLSNNGIINANLNGQVLAASSDPTITNNGLLEATNGGELDLGSTLSPGLSITGTGSLQTDATSTIKITDATVNLGNGVSLPPRGLQFRHNPGQQRHRHDRQRC